MSGFKYLHLMPIPNRFFEKSSTDEKELLLKKIKLKLKHLRSSQKIKTTSY